MTNISKEEHLRRLQEKHAQEIAAANREFDIASALPVACTRITGPEWRAPWATYERATLAEALEVMRAFTVLPAHVWRAACTMVKPEAVLTERERETYGEPKEGPFACSLHVNYLPDSPGPTSAELVFHATVENVGFLRVGVKFGKGYIGTCPHLTPRAIVSRGYRNRIESRTFDAQPDARALSDTFINWGSGDVGPIKSSAHQEFLFMAEGEEARPGAECLHALEQLQTLADTLGV